MTLDEVRSLIAQTQSAAQRAAAEQLLHEALALPHLPRERRAAAIARIRTLEPSVPDYQLSSFGARVLETVGDSLTDQEPKKMAYAEALHLARWYASGASSGGEGTARSLHVQKIEAKLQGLESASSATRQDAIKPADDARTRNQTPPPGAALTSRPQRPKFLTAVGWIFIVVGAAGIPMSLISALMILAGSDGTASGSFLGGLLVIGGPTATLFAGIGLLRRWRWAYGYVVALLFLVAAYNLVQVLGGPTPEHSTVSPDGVTHTILASSVNYPLHLLLIAICVGLLAKLLKPEMRAEFFHRVPMS